MTSVRPMNEDEVFNEMKKMVRLHVKGRETCGMLALVVYLPVSIGCLHQAGGAGKGEGNQG
ncbi:hypothetical protein BX666DRAFT_1889881 [Dichotomocladium elegans]|nr:hypothetical protein BX666DRAFT_1889881 [Dichotomocladium elegans]